MNRHLLHFTFCFVIIPFMTIAQSDSTLIHFKYVSDPDLKISNELNGIQSISIVCNDTLLHGKKFILTMQEYKTGKMVGGNNFGIRNEDQEVRVFNGKDSITISLNTASKVEFSKKDSVMLISVAGKIETNKFKLLVNYPHINFKTDLSGDELYSLREIHCTSDDQLKLPLHQKVPVLAYTPPFNTGNGGNSYCILGMEECDKWYEKFKVEHYYIFLLEVVE